MRTLICLHPKNICSWKCWRWMSCISVNEVSFFTVRILSAQVWGNTEECSDFSSGTISCLLRGSKGKTQVVQSRELTLCIPFERGWSYRNFLFRSFLICHICQFIFSNFDVLLSSARLYLKVGMQRSVCIYLLSGGAIFMTPNLSAKFGTIRQLVKRLQEVNWKPYGHVSQVLCHTTHPHARSIRVFGWCWQVRQNNGPWFQFFRRIHIPILRKLGLDLWLRTHLNLKRCRL